MSPIATFCIAAIALIAGFVLLIKGADAFVSGSSAIAKKLRVPPIVIGLTVVAMGTSLPELAVSVTASIAGNNSLAISNVTGSNLFNLMVVLGLSAVFTPLSVDKNTLKSDFPFSVVCAFLLAVLGFTGVSDMSATVPILGSLGRGEGVIFLVMFVFFLIRTVATALKARAAGKVEADSGEKELSTLRCVIYIVVGIIAIKFGGDFVVGGTQSLPNGVELQYGATAIARLFGMSETLIGLTIVSVGTSLPELVTSVVAARKNEVDMAVGNVIGSNIFNILLILGVAAAISPIEFNVENLIDLLVLVASSVLIWIFCWSKQKLSRAEGVVMLAIYAGYLVYICVR